jgi:hypothetical protein
MVVMGMLGLMMMNQYRFRGLILIDGVISVSDVVVVVRMGL